MHQSRSGPHSPECHTLRSPAAADPGRAVKLTPLTEKGYPEAIAAQRGKVVLVSFWATWCKPCTREFLALVALAERYGRRGLRIVTVSMDEASNRPAILRFLREHNARFANYLRLGSDFEAFVNAVDPDWIGALPATFVYDRDGRRIRSEVGELKAATLEKMVRAALGAT